MRAFVASVLGAAAGPIAYWGAAFLLGRYEAYPLSVLVALFVCVLISIGIFVIAYTWGTGKISGLTRLWGVCLMMVSYFVLVLAAFPDPLSLWTNGFASRLDLEELQSWAIRSLDRQARGELQLDGKCDFVAHFAPRIDDRERSNISFLSHPQVGIFGSSGFNESHIEFCWYGYQLAVGRPTLDSIDSPETLVFRRTLRPGVMLLYWDVR